MHTNPVPAAPPQPGIPATSVLEDLRLMVLGLHERLEAAERRSGGAGWIDRVTLAGLVKRLAEAAPVAHVGGGLDERLFMLEHQVQQLQRAVIAATALREQPAVPLPAAAAPEHKPVRLAVVSQAARHGLQEAIAAILAQNPNSVASAVLAALTASGFAPLPALRTVRLYCQRLRGPPPGTRRGPPERRNGSAGTHL